jgi:hypothetical protein
MSLKSKSDKDLSPKRPMPKPGYKVYGIKNGNKIVRWHVVKDNGEKTKFYPEKMERLPLEVLQGVRNGIQKDGKIKADEEYIMQELEFKMKPCQFGKFIGDMPDGACGLNAYRVHKKDPDTKIYYGYYLYEPHGEKAWYALEHFWIMKKDKKGTWRVIEHTGDEGKPASKAMFVGRECTPNEAFTYAILHDHHSLWGEKQKEE